MALSMILGEADLREMPAELRSQILTWYFNRPSQTTSDPQAMSTVESALPVANPDLDSGRIRFPQFFRAGLLQPGEAIHCRSLKRQKRNGIDTYIKGATVSADGSVLYADERYYVPSKLAMAMVNSNGGDIKATNGYEYLFVQKPHGLVSLADLRERLLGRGTTLDEEAEVQTLLSETKAFDNRKEALAFVREHGMS